jgi:hypothetical protein
MPETLGEASDNSRHRLAAGPVLLTCGHTHPVKTVLSGRQLNRALLDRQLLLNRADLGPLEAIEHLVGMQAQSAQAPYSGLWSRLSGFDPEDLSAAIGDTRAVRLTMMRTTIHLVTRRDCLRLHSVVSPVHRRSLRSNFGKDIAGLDLDELTKAGRALLEEEPLTASELGARLRALWPDRDTDRLGLAVQCLTPLVQIPPRGLWRRGGRARHTTAESWLGESPAIDSAPDALVRRYLAAFGPASVADLRTWSGLTGLAEVVDRLRPQLRAYSDESGRELLDLEDATLPDPRTPAPPRFLPEYDNVFLSHADRSRVIADEHRAVVFGRGAFLLDGFARGVWRIVTSRGVATLTLTPFDRLSTKDREALLPEAEALARFAAPEASEHRIAVADDR